MANDSSTQLTPAVPTQPSFVTEATPQPMAMAYSDATNELVRSVIAEHERGYFHSSGYIADLLDRNVRIRGALDSRVRSVLAAEQYLEAPITAADDPLAKQILGELESWWYDVANESILEGLLRYTITLGFATSEVTWKVYRNGRQVTWRPRLHPWHPSWSNYDQSVRSFYVYTLRGDRLFVQPGNGRWLQLQATALCPWMRGVVRCVGLEDSLRTQAVRDWARWSEKHGLPITRAYIPQVQANTAETAAFLRQLKQIGRQGQIKLPLDDAGKKLYDVDFAELKGIGWEGFKAILEQVDTDVSIAILGQNLTSNVKGGSLAAARVHDEVRLDIVKADAEVLSTALREQVIKPWIRYNYGEHVTYLAPWPRWRVEPPADMEAEAKVFVAVMQGIEAAARAVAAGVPVPLDVRALLTRFGIPCVEVPNA